MRFETFIGNVDNSPRPLSLAEKHILVLFIGSIPAFLIGSASGAFAAQTEFALHQFVICLLPMVVMELLLPRLWQIPAFIHAAAFYLAFSAFGSVGSAVRGFTWLCVNALSLVVGEPTRFVSMAEVHHPPFWILAASAFLCLALDFLRSGFVDRNIES